MYHTLQGVHLGQTETIKLRVEARATATMYHILQGVRSRQTAPRCLCPHERPSFGTLTYTRPSGRAKKHTTELNHQP
ncbi:hypothetical protein [Rhodoflexus sp.]